LQPVARHAYAIDARPKRNELDDDHEGLRKHHRPLAVTDERRQCLRRTGRIETSQQGNQRGICKDAAEQKEQLPAPWRAPDRIEQDETTKGQSTQHHPGLAKATAQEHRPQPDRNQADRHRSDDGTHRVSGLVHNKGDCHPGEPPQSNRHEPGGVHIEPPSTAVILARVIMAPVIFWRLWAWKRRCAHGPNVEADTVPVMAARPIPENRAMIPCPRRPLPEKGTT